VTNTKRYLKDAMRKPMDMRERRGILIALTANIIKRSDKQFQVPSQGSTGRYDVTIREFGDPSCTCEDFQTHRKKCKHIYAVEYMIRFGLDQLRPQDRKAERQRTPRSKRPTYRQNWSAYNKAQTTEQDTFQVILKDICSGIPSIPQKTGRPRHLMSDAIFGIVYKVYTTASGRRFSSDLREAHGRNHVSKMVPWCSLFRYMESELTTPILHTLIEMSAMPLKDFETEFAVDGTEFSTRRFFRGSGSKYASELDKALTIKLNAMCGVKTHIMTSVKVLGYYKNESPSLPDLIADTDQHFNIKEVSADKGYVGTKNRLAIIGVGAEPYIPFRTNATGEGSTDDTAYESVLITQLYHKFSLKREEFLKHYHKRSNIESAFMMIKSKFGNAVRSKTDTARTNEVLCKVLCHNIYVLCQQISLGNIKLDFRAQ
jgi:hypothetical protein